MSLSQTASHISGQLDRLSEQSACRLAQAIVCALAGLDIQQSLDRDSSSTAGHAYACRRGSVLPNTNCTILAEPAVGDIRPASTEPWISLPVICTHVFGHSYVS